MSTLLRSLITEGTAYNRVSLMRIEAVMANIADKLTDKEQEKLAGAYVELKLLSDGLNQTAYTIYNQSQWQLLQLVLAGKIAELRLVVEDIAEDHAEVDCHPLMNAIELILTY